MKMPKQIMLLLLILVLVTGVPVFAMAEEPLSGDIVKNEYELNQWCKDNYESGGKVTLSESITISDKYYFTCGSDADVTIDTGSYGIIYNGGFLPYEFEIIGEGVDEPVLTVVDPNMFMSSWSQSIQNLKVTATGRDDGSDLLGGTAVFVKSANNDVSPNMGEMLTEGEILSYGENAVGVKISDNITEPLDIYCFNIKTYGESSIAVLAPNGVNLYYCKLDSAGQGSLAAKGDDILLDTCRVVGDLPESAKIIQRKITDISGVRLYMPIRQHEIETEYLLWEHFLINFILSGDGEPPKSTLGVIWDEDKIQSIDTRKLGMSTIGGILTPPLAGLGLTDDYTIEFTFEVWDPKVPCIGEIMFQEDYTGKYVFFGLWEFDGWTKDDVIIWRSDDEGATWYDYSDSDQLKWLYDDNLAFNYDNITDPIWFQIEVPGHGESNVVSLYSKDGLTMGGTGGDRTGVDRVIGKNPEDPDKDLPGNPNNDPAVDPPDNKNQDPSKPNQTDPANPVNKKDQKLKSNGITSWTPLDTVSADTRSNNSLVQDIVKVEKLPVAEIPASSGSDPITAKESSGVNLAIIITACAAILLTAGTLFIRFFKLRRS